MSDSSLYRQCQDRIGNLYRARPNFTAVDSNDTHFGHGTGVSSPNLESWIFSETCASTGSTFPRWDVPSNASAIVFNVSTVMETGVESAAKITLSLGNCDGSEWFNVTSTGVYVVKGAYALAYISRLPVNGVLSECDKGSGRVNYTASPLEEFCKADATIPECHSVVTAKDDSSQASTNKSSSEAPKSAAPGRTLKRTLAVAAAIASVVAAAALT